MNEQANMAARYEHEIPEGYEARIEDNKVIFESKECEDERIRKTLINIVKGACSKYGIKYTWDEISEEKLLAYLEKQKEQSFTHHEIDESLRDAVTHQMEDDGDVDNFVRRGIDDIALKYALLGARWQKEQKPVFSDDIEREIRDWWLNGWKNCTDYSSFKSTVEHFYNLGKSKQKPVEWSEEDKHAMDWLLNLVDGCQISDKDKIFLSDWIDSLRNRFVPEHTEWSEEDERHRQWVLECLADGKRKVPDYADQYQAAFNWLKSLRPPFKDKEMKLKILKYLSTRCSSLEFEEVEDYLNNLRPSWKPSEEQMEALDKAIPVCMGVAGREEVAPLESLYNDLKKLM